MVFKNGAFYQLATPEGRAVYQSGAWSYEYFHTDHLGNTRIAYKANGTALSKTSETSFDPWGIVLRDAGVVNTFQNRFEYQNKEKKSTFNLRRIDFGARSYNASIGRFDRVDPLADIARRFSPYTYVYNNSLLFVDPDGRFGDLYDQKGNKVGTDNINDGKIYVVTDKQTVKDLKSSGGVVASAGAVNSALELPSAFVRSEMGKAVDRSNSANDKRIDEFKGDDNEGGFHEEGGVYGTGTNGEDKVVHAKPGAKTDPVEQGMATVSPSDAAIPSQIAADGSFHVHPSGSRSGSSNCIGCKSGYFNQSPTKPIDYNEAKGYPKNSYVLGARDGTVSIYNGNSTKPVATFPLEKFRKIGN